MKRKIFFFVIIFVFAICGVFGSVNFDVFIASAVSADVADDWEGETLEEDDISDSDFYSPSTSSTEFYINSAKGFVWFAQLVSGTTGTTSTFRSCTIYLTVDIDLQNYAFETIGNSTNYFQGTFQGQGHFIYNLNLTASEDSSTGVTYSALFAVSTGKIYDLHLRNLTNSVSATYMAAFVGQNNSGTISGCSVRGEISLSSADSFATASDVSGVFIGGIAAYSTGTITSCANLASISVEAESSSSDVAIVGGIAGAAVNSISTSYNAGEISFASTCEAYVAGLVGVAGLSANSTSSRTLTARNCYNSADVNAQNTTGAVGGMFGIVCCSLSTYFSYNSASTYVCENANVSTSYVAAGNFLGRLFASTLSVTLSNCMDLGCIYLGSSTDATFVSYSTSSGSPTCSGFVSASSSAELTNLKNYAKNYEFYTTLTDGCYFAGSWNLSDTWTLSQSVNGGLPYLDILPASNDRSSTGQSSSLRGQGTEEDPYIIESAGDLALVDSINSNASGAVLYYSLASDIDLSGRTWTPIGYSKAFNGVFDGNNHTITGLSTSLQTAFSYVGLFGRTSYAVIKNLTLSSVQYVDSTKSGAKVGTLIGSAENTYIINVAAEGYGNYYSIGSAQSSYVIYGKNNLNGESELDEVNNPTIEYSSGGITNGYDITFNANGANIKKYSSSNLVNYTYGVFHLIVVPSTDQTYAKVISVTSASGKIIDSTYQTMLPIDRLDTLTSADLVLYRSKSVKFAGYTDANNDVITQSVSGSSSKVSLISVCEEGQTSSSSKFSSFAASLISGVWAVWENAYPVSMHVYNAYEIVQFSSTVDETASYLDGTIESGIDITSLSGQSLIAQLEELNASRFSSENGSTIYLLDENGDKTSTTLEAGKIYLDTSTGLIFKLGWLTYGQTWSTFSSQSATDAQTLRGDGYEISYWYDAIYEDLQSAQEYSSKLIKENQTLYAYWGATSTAGNSLTITFVKEADNFSFTDAIVNLILCKTSTQDGETAQDTVEKNITQTGSEVSCTFTFDSSYSMCDVENYLTFLFNLNVGYEASVSTNFATASFDTNFGVLSGFNDSSLSTDLSLALGNGTVVNDYGIGYAVYQNLTSTTCFYNLSGSATITYTIKKSIFEDQIYLDGDVYFGIGSRQLVTISESGGTYSTNLKLSQNGSIFTSIDSVLGQDLLLELYSAQNDGSNIYVAFDFVNQKILFSNEDVTTDSAASSGSQQAQEWFDIVDFSGITALENFVQAASGTQNLYVTIGSTTFTYTLQKSDIACTYNSSDLDYGLNVATITMTSTDSVEEFVFRLNLAYDPSSYELAYPTAPTYFTVEYYTGASFVIMGQSENSAVVFKDDGYGYSVNDGYVIDTYEEDGVQVSKQQVEKLVGEYTTSSGVWANVSKVMFNFYNISKVIGASSDMSNTSNNVITLVAGYSKVFLEFEIVYVDGDGNEVSSNLPTLSLTSATLSAEVASTLQIVVTRSNYYEFDYYLDTSSGTQYLAYVHLDNETSSGTVNLSIDSNSSSTSSDYIARALVSLDSTYTTSTAATLTLTTNSTIAAGKYVVTLYSKEVEYTLSYQTKFATESSFSASTTQIVSAIQNGSFFTDSESESGSGITKSVEIAQTSAQLSSNKVTGVKWYESVYLTTEREKTTNSETGETEENQAYTFKGWYFESDGEGAFVSASADDDGLATKSYSTYQLLSVVPKTTSSTLLESRNVTVYAVYAQNQFSLSMDDDFLIASLNGEDDTLGSDVNLSYRPSFSLSNSSGGTTYSLANPYTYTYSCSDSSSPDTLYLSMDLYSEGYYFAGYRLVDSNGNLIFSYTAEDGQSVYYDYVDSVLLSQLMLVYTSSSTIISVQNGIMQLDLAWMKTAMENAHISGTYYIQPIIKQKTTSLVFHSGATEEYNATSKIGQVFNSSGEETTETILAYVTAQTSSQYITSQVNANSTDTNYIMTKIYFGQSVESFDEGGFTLAVVSLDENGDVVCDEDGYVTISDDATTEALSDIFASRTGYRDPVTNYWSYIAQGESAQNSSTIYTNNLTASSSLFFEDSQTEYVTHLYRNWQAESYIITLSQSDATTLGTTSVTAEYDSTTSFAITNPQRVGYDFAGWADGDGNLVIDEDGALQKGVSNGSLTYTDTDGIWVLAQNVTLYAVWEAKTYTITINFNSGYWNSGNGDKTITSKTFTIEYDQAFSTLMDGENVLVKNDAGDVYGLEYVASMLARDGFDFAEFYCISGSSAKIVSEDTIFDNSLFGFEDSTAMAITLYADWAYDESVVGSITLEQNTISTTYNGYDQTYTLISGNDESHYLFTTTGYIGQDNDSEGAFTLSVTDSAMTITTSLTSITAKNAGLAYASVVVSITDEAEYLSHGTLATWEFVIYLYIEKADLSISTTESLKVKNAKNLMEPYVDEDAMTNKLSSATSLADICAVEKEIATLYGDTSLSGITDEEAIYEYIQVKYYFIGTTASGDDLTTYRAWTYEKYLAYKAANADEVSTILSNTIYFMFYDHTNTSSQISISGYSGLIQVVGVVEADNSYNISASAYGTSSIVANSVQSLRVYVSSSYAQNYNVVSDGSGNYYINTSCNVYVLPEVVSVDSPFSTISTYYSAEYTDYRTVSWDYVSSDSQTTWEDTKIVANRTYYRLYQTSTDALYVYAKINTSNAGDASQNVEFSQNDTNNYLYFSEVKILLYVLNGSSQYYSDVTNQYKLVLSNSTIFTILSIADVAQLTIDATYLTQENGNTSSATISNSMATEILSISSVTWKDESGDEHTITSISEGAQYVSQQDEQGSSVLLFELSGNNSNTITMNIRLLEEGEDSGIYVTSVTVKVSDISVSEYIQLYKWKTGEFSWEDDWDSSYAPSDSYTIDLSSTYTSSEALTQIYACAVFTDLVYMEFNYDNLDLNGDGKADFSGLETNNVIKLGSTTVDDIWLPDISGLSLVSAYVYGTTIDLLDGSSGEATFFAGSGSTYGGLVGSVSGYLDVRQKLVLSFGWGAEEIDATQVTDSYSAAVSSTTTYAYSNFVNISNLNEQIYTYTYLWTLPDGSTYEGKSLLFSDGGTANESGTYKLTITATIIDSLLSSGAVSKYVVAGVGGQNDFAFEDGVTYYILQNGSYVSTNTLTSGQTYYIDNSSSSTTFSVELNFMPNLITSITLQTSTESTYNTKEKSSSLSITLSYVTYSTIDGYNTDAQEYTIVYSSAGTIYFEIYNSSGEKVSSMLDADTYSIVVRFATGKFSLSDDYFASDSSNNVFFLAGTGGESDFEFAIGTTYYEYSGGSYVVTQDETPESGKEYFTRVGELDEGEFVATYTYTIKPYTVDLQQYTISYGKTFGSSDPVMEYESHALASESFTFSMSRTSGEDVGDDYLLYISSAVSKNFTLTWGDTVLCEGGALTADAATQSVGTFTISASGTLLISVEEDLSGETLPASAEYVVDGYSISLAASDDKTYLLLVISTGSDVVRKLKLSLYDVSNGSLLTDSTLLSIFVENVIDANALQAMFYSTSTYESSATATDAGTYYFNFTTGEAFLKYYTSVQIDDTFTITQKTITLDELVALNSNIFVKTYDGTLTKTVDLGTTDYFGTQYSGLTLLVSYATTHVGSGIYVDLSLSSTNADLNISNFKLGSSYSNSGQITKLSATASISLSKSSYTYGDVNLNSLSSLLAGGTFTEAGAISVTGTDKKTYSVDENYFSLSYSLKYSDAVQSANEVKANGNGYVYVGAYCLTVSGSFDDFDIDLSALSLNFSITVLAVDAAGYTDFITITTEDALPASYSRSQTVGATGDVLEVLYYVVDGSGEAYSAGTYLSKGYYELKLSTTSFCNSSITLSIASGNKYFTVYVAADTITLTLASSPTSAYNGVAYTFGADTSNHLLIVSNGGTKVAEIAYTLKNSSGEDVTSSISFETLEFSSSSAMTNAGSYLISMTAEADGYNFVFGASYYLTITPIEIDASEITSLFTKTFDMSSTLTISASKLSSVASIVSTDDISVVVTFSDYNVGSPKSILSIVLSGGKVANYTLTNTTGLTGSITAATATISMSSTVFTYGQIYSLGSEFSTALTSCISVKSSGSEISASQYSLSINIKKYGTDDDAEYTDSGYLNVGSGNYTIYISNTMDGNYTIANASFDITVTALVLEDLVFTKDGAISVAYGTARDGTDVEYLVLTSLYETVTFVFTRESSSTEIGYYHLEEATSLASEDGNYIISMTDSSTRGAFAIVIGSTILYLLVDEGDEISTSETQTISMTYCGSEVSALSLVQDDDESWKIAITTSGGQSFVSLALYTYDGDKYTKFTSYTISDISASLSFTSSSVKNVGTYNIAASGVTCETHNITIGKNGGTYAFYFEITVKTLYLNADATYTYEDGTSENVLQSGIFVKTFNNQNAQYSFSSAASLLYGVATSDDLTLTITLYSGSDVAKYATVSNSLTVKAELSGTAAGNYVLAQEGENFLCCDSEGSSIKVVTGWITKAGITLVIDTQYFTYGDLSVDENNVCTLTNLISYSFETGIEDFDISSYVTERYGAGKTIADYVTITASGDKSTSGYLKQGSYLLNISVLFDDLQVTYYLLDNASVSSSDAKVWLNVSQKQLSLQKISNELSDIFTKTYDGTADIEIFDNQELLFAISGILGSDDVTVASATYDSSSVGQRTISFTLSGDDCDNYSLSSTTGTINYVVVNLVFDYKNIKDGDGNAINIISNVEYNNLEQLSSLNFPFKSSTLLTGNSASTASSTTSSFPTTLLYYSGHTFSHWTLEIVADTTAKQEKLEGWLSSTGLKYTFDDETNTYSITVGNNEATVSLLKELLLDEDDLFGYYYQNSGNDLTFTFTPNWTLTSYTISLSTQNASSQTGVFAEIQVYVDDDYLETITTSSYESNFDWGSTVEFRIYAKSHYSYSNATGEGFTSGNRDDYYYIQFSSLSASHTGIVLTFDVQSVTVVLDLSAQLQQIESGDLVVSNLGSFTSQGDGTYKWESDYFTLTSVTLESLPTLTWAGRSLASIKSTAGKAASKDEFSSTYLSDFVQTNLSETVTLSAEFEYADITVTLDYNYDSNNDGVNETEEILVTYLSTYGSSSGWVDTPKRTGYTFLGWVNEKGETITSSTQNTKTEAHTIYATWELQKFDISVTISNGTISSASQSHTLAGSTYTFSDVEYGTTLTFTVSPNTGWSFEAGVFDGYTISSEGLVTVNVTKALSFSITLTANTNIITLSGDNVSEIQVYDLTDPTNEIEVSDLKFEALSGRTIKIVVTPKEGYVMTNTVGFDVQNTSYTAVVEDGVLTVTIKVSSDLSLTFNSQERENVVSLSFDDTSKIAYISIGMYQYTLDNLPQITTTVSETLKISVTFVQGYKRSTQSLNTTATAAELSVGDEEEDSLWVSTFTLANLTADAELSIATAIRTYTLTVEIIAYDSALEKIENSGNMVYVAGSNTQLSVTVEFNTTISIVASAVGNYNFAGWELSDGTIYSSDADEIYTVSCDETIYAVFSALSYSVNLSVLDFVQYQDGTSEYREVSGGSFVYNSNAVTIVKVYYGTTLELTFNLPDGYYYLGFGYYVGEEFKFAESTYINSSSVEVSINTLLFEDTIDQLYFVVSAHSIEVSVSTQIDVDGVILEDLDVGKVELVDKYGAAVDEDGYVLSSRTHISGAASTKAFVGVVYTGDVMYIKVSMQKSGYEIYGLTLVNLGSATWAKVESTDEYTIFAIYSLVGGISASGSVIVSFMPILNCITLNMSDGENTVNGGGFVATDTSDVGTTMVWIAGSNLSTLQVFGYSGGSFVVSAYIRAGYTFSEILDDEGITSNVKYTSLSIESTGFTGKVTFTVSGYLDSSTITLVVLPTTYTVVLKDGDSQLAIIKNVAFGSEIDLSENNSENITILDSRLSYVGGVLNVKISKSGYDFQGYFTLENGAGVQYISSSGGTTKSWDESGYTYSTVDDAYLLSDNVELTEGDMTVYLYTYFSYLKTRITFQFTPSVSLFTAKDLVSGVDESNSWYYSVSSSVMEVSFGTSVTITAPEISGYKFYKFVFSQRTGDDVWLSDVTTYSNSVPWSTNSSENIVEMTVTLVYYVQVDVQVHGGDATFSITQATATDSQAKALLAEGYVDSTTSFTILALPSSGYEFLYWVTPSTGAISHSDSITLKASQKTTLDMYVQGEAVTLDFSSYATTYGQIVKVKVESLDGTTQTYSNLIRKDSSSGTYTKLVTQIEAKVGDTVTFVMDVDYGFAVVWNREDIVYSSYSSGQYNFTMDVQTSDAGKILEILPSFTNQTMSIYITLSLDEEMEAALDSNKPSAAGSTLVDGKQQTYFYVEQGNDITIDVETNTRYKVVGVIITNYANTFTSEDNFLNEDGQIVLSAQYLEENSIEGVIGVEIVFTRLLWEENEGAQSLSGDGTSDSPYLISNAEELALMSRLVNSGQANEYGVLYSECHFKLTSSIILSEEFWTPIGTQENPFNGNFNFNNFSVTGIYTILIYDVVSYNGLFGVLGANAVITTSPVSIWYVYLAVGLVGGLGLILGGTLYVNARRKKRRQELQSR